MAHNLRPHISDRCNTCQTKRGVRALKRLREIIVRIEILIVVREVEIMNGKTMVKIKVIDMATNMYIFFLMNVKT